jgi:hypothetical protein
VFDEIIEDPTKDLGVLPDPLRHQPRQYPAGKARGARADVLLEGRPPPGGLERGLTSLQANLRSTFQGARFRRGQKGFLTVNHAGNPSTRRRIRQRRCARIPGEMGSCSCGTTT